jgi:hypothetical protein
MTTITDLFDKLQQGNDTSVITLDSSTLSPDLGMADKVYELLHQSLGQNSLAIQLSESLSHTADKINIVGQATVLNAGITEVSGKFTVSDQGQLRLAIKFILPKPEGVNGWYFSHSFPSTSELGYDFLNILDPAFYFSSYPNQNSEVFFQLQTGLNFQANLVLSKHLLPITQDTKQSEVEPVRFGGHIDTTQSPPKLNFNGEKLLSDLGANLLGRDSIIISQGSLSTTPSNKLSIMGKTELIGESFDVELSIPSQVHEHSQTIIFRGDIPITDLKNALNLLGGEGLSNLFPDSFLKISDIEIKHLEFQFNPFGIGETASRIEISTTNATTGWELAASPSLVIKNFSLGLSTRTHQVSAGQFQRVFGGFVNGTFKFNDSLEVEVEVATEDFGDWVIAIEQKTDEPNLQHIVNLLGASHSDVLASLPEAIRTAPTLAIRHINIGVHPFSPSTINFASFAIQQSAKWVIAQNILEVDHWSIDFLISKTEQGWDKSGMLSGSVRLASIYIAVSIPIPLSGIAVLQLEEDVHLPSLGEVTQLLGGKHLGNILPHSVGDIGGFSLTDFRLEAVIKPFKLERLAFALSSEKPWVILENRLVIESLDFALDIRNPTSDNRELTGSIHGLIDVGNISLFISVDRTYPNEDWLFNLHSKFVSLPSLASISDLTGQNTLDVMLKIFPSSIVNGHIDIKNLDLNVSLGKDAGFKGIGFTLALAEGNEQEADSIWGTEVIFSTTAIANSTNSGWQVDISTGRGQAIPIGQVVSDLAKRFNFTHANFPEALKSLVVENIILSFNSGNKDFLFSLETKMHLDNTELDANIKISVTHNNGKYTRKFSGIVKVADLEFDLVFQQEQAADTLFLAAYENRAGKDQNIKALAKLITDDPELLDVAEGITFNLKDALLVIDKAPAVGNTPAETKLLFGLDIGSGLDISKLPLVGKSFPAGSTVQVKLQPLLTNKNFTPDQLKKARSLVPAGGYNLPQTADKRIDINIQLLIGKETIDLSLPVSIDAVKSQPALGSSPVSSTLSTVSNNATPAPPAAAGKIKWFPIQKQLGPINFGRIGVQYEKSEITFLLDASISLAGLNLSVDGLFVHSKLNPLHPTFGLHGMGIDYSKGPLEIGGAFLRQTLTDPQGNSYDSYDGTAIIRTPSFALAALGSYAYYQGHPSLFIYAFLDAPIGGPAFFFVTGLAAGFGYNRRLVMPTINQVNTFPLVAEAMSGVPGTTNDLGAEIEKLHSVIPPSIGDYFLAVGIRFTSFEIIDSFVLLAVSFGNDFEVDVLGLSTLVIPTPEEGDAVEPLAEIQMALSAVFNPGKGYLKVRAALTSASFILSRNCHLTGGFAFYTWFKDNPAEGAAAGDFVLTVGGYHPRFKPPGYYPKVAPLGFNWQVTRELVLKGDFYFALVPSAVMAGGHLSATWISGNLKAWFRLGADFIISWKPYFYDASMYLDMGVSYTYHFFGTHHISVDVGADLHIWGPEFSGVAHVHLWIVSFTVRFGAHTNPEKPALTWPQFHDAFLPDNSKWEALTVAQGLVKQLGTEERPIYIINPKDFKLETSSALPITSSNQSLGDANTNIHVGSMKITDPITTVHNVSISYESVDPQTGAKTWQSVTDDFIFEPVKKHVPGAVWGDKFKHSENETDDKRLIKNACTGFTVSGKPIIPSEQSHSVLTKNLLNTEEPFLPTISIGDAAEVGDDWLQSNNLELESKAAERHALLHDLGFLDNYFPNNELAEEFILTTG